VSAMRIDFKHREEIATGGQEETDRCWNAGVG
jgi:hypothetical protein